MSKSKKIYTSIPRSFKLFASTIKIVWNNKRMDDVKAYGYYDHSKAIITLTNVDGLDKLSDDRKVDSFYHEKIHAILEAMHEHELSSNEKFVDVFAKLLRQSDETSKY